MRRITANPLPLGPVDGPIDLSALTCRLCGVAGVTIVALGRDDNGAIERVWCGLSCARVQGWPFMVGETTRGAPVLLDGSCAVRSSPTACF